MSTNIKVQRICQFCGKEFTARTTVTQYCSDNCAKRAYKARQRATKVETSNKETIQIKSKPIEDLKVQEFLSVRHVAKLIGSSRQTVYNLINTGKLQAVNILKKKTIVRRCDLDKLFEQPTPIIQLADTNPEPIQYEIDDCYTLKEVQNKYGVSETALQNLIKRNNIPKIKKGWFAYVPKDMIDNILT